MRQIIILTLMFTLFLGGCSDQNNDTNWPEITVENKPWTRWWWLGSDVDSAGLTYNLEALSNAGIGGVEITPIYGVKERESHYIEYLSPNWMKMLDFTITEAERLGMGVDMNNGTGWPFGGPHVNVEDAATKAFFSHSKINGGEKLENKIEVSDRRQINISYIDKVMAYSQDGEIIDLTDKVTDEGYLDWVAPEGRDYNVVTLFVGKSRQQVKRAAPGGEGYVLNHFDKDAVMRYLDRFDKAFAENDTPFPNTFFNDSYEVYGADWSPNLLDQFEQKRGYKLQDYFQELLADGATETSVRVITDYRETVGDILLENFTKPWTEWAHSHGVKTRNQAHGSPANLIDVYASVDIPECESFGITDFDIPGLRKDSIRKENDSDPTIIKYASSAANISGKKYTSSETFTWLTEHFRTSLSQAKPEIDQMFASGVNRVYFHGSTYSPEDVKWPGWKFYASVDMSPTNTIWKDAPAFFSYITRVQSFLQSGKPDNDFLLYLPIYDIWEEQRGNYFTTFAIHGMRERLPEFCDAVDRIMMSGYDLDYISDHFIMSTTIENGLIKTEGGATYKALILPAVKNIPLETIEKIKKITEQGATVIFVDQYPSDVPGLASLEERKEQFNMIMLDFPKVSTFESVAKNDLGKGTIVTGNSYSDILELWSNSQEKFVSELGGQMVRRKHENGHIYFMSMLSNNPIDGWVGLGVEAKSAMIFDPMSGEKGKAQLRKNNERIEIYLQLKPGESVIIKTFDNDVNTNGWNYYSSATEVVNLGNDWQLSFIDSDPVVEESFNVDTLMSWTDIDNDSLKVNRGTGLYKKAFQFNKNADSEYLLSLGDVRESAKVRINGKDAGTLYAVPFEIKIGELLQDGENTIEIEVTNLPANRIADFDRKGVEWRIFHEINFVSITYQPTQFDIWYIMPSGLLGPVTINEIKTITL